MKIRIKRGLDIPLAGAPAAEVDASSPIRRVAVLGSDYIGLKPRMLAREGDRVRLGDPLFADKRVPEIRITAPGTGVVEAVNRGARRVLESVVIALDEGGGASEAAGEPLDPTTLASEATVARLTASGLWCALRARPFGHVPDPATRPGSIFVTAIDTDPLAAAPASVLATAPDRFRAGLAVLESLTDGAVYVCVAPGDEEAFTAPGNDSGRCRVVAFDGPHPAGLPGTHIHFLDPVSASYSVWHIGFQDVMAMGALFAEGVNDPTRIVALAGPQVRNPRLVRARLGASTADLADGELAGGESRLISGPVLSGRRAAGSARFLGRYHTQVCVLAEGREREFLGWLTPGRNRYSAIRAFLSGLMPARAHPLTTTQNGSPRAMVPIGNFERVMPLDILPAPLLKALVVGDTETAIDLGCLELVEEDVALLSFVDCGKYEYGPVLRQTLDDIRKES